MWLACAAIGCGEGPGAGVEDASRSDGGVEAGPGMDGGLDDAEAGDAGGGDAGSVDAAAPDAAVADAAPTDAGPLPTTLLGPAPGEVTILQLELPVGLIPQTGESALLVGPDGTIAVLDVGNSGHDDDVRAAIRDLNTRWITVANGFPRARRPLEVEWIVLSHFHSDHIGGLPDLLSGSDAVEVTQGIVHRGLVDVGSAATESDYTPFCDLVTGSMAALDVPLCVGASSGSCSVDDAATNPAVSCDGLFRGDLSDAADDSLGEPSFLPLGGDARMVLIGADGFVSDGTSAHAMTFGHTDSNEENARSLVTIVEHGAFRYHWGGDLTGSGDAGQPDVESHLALHAEAVFYGPAGMDVVHAHHHVRRTSSNATFIDLAAPLDGHDRNVVGGVNGAYVLSPYAEVMDRWSSGGRLGEGRIWVTNTAAGGGTSDALVVAASTVVVRTHGGGAGYWVQASDAPTGTRGYTSVR